MQVELVGARATDEKTPSPVGPAMSGDNRRRSERVMLRMTMIIRVDAEGQEIRGEAETQVVNAHGGLIRTKVRLMNGQTFRISNPKNGLEESCRVVRSEVKEAEYYSVGFEFDRPSPNFWPIVFPPADWVEPVGGRYRS